MKKINPIELKAFSLKNTLLYYKTLYSFSIKTKGVPLTLLKLSPNFQLNDDVPTLPTAPLQLSTSQTNISAPPLPLSSSLSTSSATLNYASIQPSTPPVISMPMPYHITYDSSSSSSSSSGYAAGECSSSSISPATNSSSSSNHQLSPVTKPKSNYLLTTASSSSMGLPAMSTINNHDNPPPYPVSTMKRNLNVNKNQTNIENHYNNSNQSLSDGKLKENNLFF